MSQIKDADIPLERDAFLRTLNQEYYKPKE